MRLSAFILSVVLAFLFSGASSPERSGSRVVCSDLLQSSEQTALAPDWSDCFALETAQLSVPYPMRLVRKSYERQQKLSVDIRDAYSERYFTRIQCGSNPTASRLLSAISLVVPFHDADYLKFGILVI